MDRERRREALQNNDAYWQELPGVREFGRRMAQRVNEAALAAITGESQPKEVTLADIAQNIRGKVEAEAIEDDIALINMTRRIFEQPMNGDFKDLKGL